MQSFLRRLQQGRFEFSLHCVDALELGSCLGPRTYDRIEVSNICDGGYLGIQKTLEVVGCHLSPNAINPHATLITLFINAVKEMQKWLGEDGLDLKGLSKFLPPLSFESMLNTQSPEMTRYWDARDMVVDVDRYFRSYMTATRFDEASKFGMRKKGQNIIVEA